MDIFKNRSIKYKLIIISLLTTGIVLLIASASLITNEFLLFRRSLIDDITVQARITGDNSAASLDFDDQKTAGEILSALKASTNIVHAVIYNKEGKVFAVYRREDVRETFFSPPDLPVEDSYHFTRKYLNVFQKIVSHDNVVGTIYIQSDLSRLVVALTRYGATVAVIIVVSLSIAFLILSRLQLTITRPIAMLRQVTSRIAQEDFSARAAADSRDEIGQLAVSFNKMVDDLQTSRMELVAARDYTENIMGSMLDTLIVVNTDRTIKTVNHAALAILGYTRDELVNKPIDLILPEVESLFDNTGITDQLKTGLVANVEETYIAKDGRRIPVLFSGSVMRDNRDNIQGIVCVALDITEHKQFEGERQNLQLMIMQNAKLASLGEVATGVAHEINQPLAFINSIIQSFRIDIEQDALDTPVLLKELAMCNKQVERIDDIIQHLRTFGRRDEIVKQKCQIETILENTLLLLGERLRLRNVRMITDVAPDLPGITGSPNQLEQVFINLFQNSMGAFPDTAGDAELRVTIARSYDSQSIIISVTDNGKGIEKEILDKIFEPFFTTKAVGEGTGLGLSIIYGIIREHNGTISCESTPGTGTTFTVTLPVAL